MNTKRLCLRHYILLQPPSGAVKILMGSSCKFIEDSQTLDSPWEHEKQLLSICTGGGCFLQEALTYRSALQQVHVYVQCILDSAHLAGSTRFHICISVRLHQLHHSAENQL